MTDIADSFDYSQIPDMPSDADLERRILETGNPLTWRPHAAEGAPAPDLSNLSEASLGRVYQARIAVGPGPGANAYQAVVFEQYNRMISLEQEEARLMDELTAAASYDPQTGDAIPLASPTRRNAIMTRLSEAMEERRRIQGIGGQTKLRKGLDEAVKAEKVRIRREWALDQAKRLAAQEAADEEIRRLADGFRKTRPNP